MKTIIITGKQGLGKTELARLIADGKEAIEITSLKDIKYIKYTTKCIIFDELSKRNNKDFLELSSKLLLTFRPPYCKNEITIDVSKVLLIGITNDKIEVPRHCFCYNLV